jgi:hypothetical protein
LGGVEMKTRSVIAALAIGALAASSAPAIANDLDEVTDPGWVLVLAGFEVLAEVAHPKAPFHIRVLRVRDHGECNGSPQSCPLSTLYLAISEYGDPPDQRVFRLPRRHDWEFVRWVRLGGDDPSVTSVELELKANEPSPQPEKGWWLERHYLATISPYQKGSLSPR